jgi:hypothetical protein
LEEVRQLENTIQSGNVEKELFSKKKKGDDENIYGQDEN